MESVILKIMFKRVKWLKYRGFIVPTSMSTLGNYVLEALDNYYRRFDKSDEIDLSKFSTWVLFSAPHDKHEELREIFASIGSTVVTDEEEEWAFSGLVRRDFANKIAREALEVVDGNKHELDAVETLVEDYKLKIGRVAKVDSYFVDNPLEDILTRSVGGLEWRLPCLRKAIGTIGKGDLLGVGARVNAGKTTFLASEATYMAAQMAGQKVLWVNLEERGSKVKRRIIQAALGWDNKKLLADPKKTMDAYLDMYDGKDPIRLLDKADCSPNEIELALKRDDYGLIIIDMVGKLHGFYGRGDEVTRQGLLFGWARETAKKYAPLITVAQLSGDAEGMEWPNMGCLYGSRTAIQAELDGLIMIGKSNDVTRESERYIGIVKNKFEDIDPLYRAGRFTVEILPEIARYQEYP